MDWFPISSVTIVCVIVAWVVVYILAARPASSRASRGKTVTRSARKTFRVQGVPRGWQIDSLQSFLCDKSHTCVTVLSLADSVDGPFQTATVTFETLPDSLKLNDPRDIPKKWRIRISEESKSQIELDDKFLGLTSLYTPPLADHKIDVVAICGLGGHAFGSFQEKSQGHMWLRDSLPDDIVHEQRSMARIMTFGYESALVDSKSIQDFEDLASSFLLSLPNLRPYRPILFIAHSLGGLIVKQIMVALSKSNGEDDQALLRSIHGIFFFGTPHDGMDISSLIPMVGDGPNRFLVESISRFNTQALRPLHDDFHDLLDDNGRVEVVSFYETVESPTAQRDASGKWSMSGPTAILVTKSSAKHNSLYKDDSIRNCAIARTHSTMVKFGQHDDEYNKVRQIICEVARRSLQHRAGYVESEKTRQRRWGKNWQNPSRERRTHYIPVDEFSCLHEKDVDADYRSLGLLFWYRETVEDETGYPPGVAVDSAFLTKRTQPVGNRIITCRRIANLQIRGHSKWILPGRYRVVWILWFFAGENYPPSSSSTGLPGGYSPRRPFANSVSERRFLADDSTPDSGWIYPWRLRCSAGRAKEPKNFLYQDVNVDLHRCIPPQLLVDGYGEAVVEPGLWNTLKNTGWCEVVGPAIDIGNDGEAFFLISKDFERIWIGGFSFGGVRLEPIS